jgi:hypothetical protein
LCVTGTRLFIVLLFSCRFHARREKDDDNIFPRIVVVVAEGGSRENICCLCSQLSLPVT